VRCGPGKCGDDGERKAPTVKEGDKVIYFKYAGDQMETPQGEQFVVIHEQDILARL
jgi:chaperonin GroES